MLPRALVVEDDRNTRDALRAIIQGEGFVVDAVGDGEAALALLSTQTYEVILIDIILPGMSGTALMEQLRDLNPRALDAVVVVTGLDVHEIRSLFPAVRHTLSKPVLPSRLRATVRMCLQGQDSAAGGASSVA